MTLVQLSYLVALDNVRHFRQAAMHLGISQPNLSNQLSSLERELGIQLFDRTQKPIRPTLIGEEVIRQARFIIAETERLKLIVKGMAGGMAGHLRVGVVPTLAPYLIPMVLPRIAQRYPDVIVEVHEMAEKQTIEYIKRDLIDVALVAEQQDAQGIIAERLFEEPLVCYVSRDHDLYRKDKIQSGELQLSDLWLLKAGNALRDNVISLCAPDQGSDVNIHSIRFESDSLEVLKRLVENGRKMTVLPWLAVAASAPHQSELIRPFADPVPYRGIHIMFGTSLLQKQLVQVLAEEIKEVIAPLLPHVGAD